MTTDHGCGGVGCSTTTMLCSRPLSRPVGVGDSTVVSRIDKLESSGAVRCITALYGRRRHCENGSFLLKEKRKRDQETRDQAGRRRCLSRAGTSASLTLTMTWSPESMPFSGPGDIVALLQVLYYGSAPGRDCHRFA